MSYLGLVLLKNNAKGWDWMNYTKESGALFEHLLAKRILFLDGAMGTMIQSYKLTEADYRS